MVLVVSFTGLVRPSQRRVIAAPLQTSLTYPVSVLFRVFASVCVCVCVFVMRVGHCLPEKGYRYVGSLLLFFLQGEYIRLSFFVSE